MYSLVLFGLVDIKWREKGSQLFPACQAYTHNTAANDLRWLGVGGIEMIDGCHISKEILF